MVESAKLTSGKKREEGIRESVADEEKKLKGKM